MPSSRADRIDWTAVEQEYRVGVLSVRDLARKHGVSHTAINKRAAAEGWTQDLTGAVRRKAARKIVETTAEGRADLSDDELADAAARQQVEVLRSHRKAIAGAHRTCKLLLAELMAETMCSKEVSNLMEALALEEGGGDGRRDAALKNLAKQAISLPSRASAMRQLSGALKDLTLLERQAFNLDAEAEGDADIVPLEERIKALTRRDLIERSDGKVTDLEQRRAGG